VGSFNFFNPRQSKKQLIVSEHLQNFSLKFVQLVIIATPIFIFFYLLNINFVPNGVFEISKTVNERSPYVNDLAPGDRVELPTQEPDGTWSQKIIDDPAFFFVHPQRFFNKGELEIRFKNTNVPFVELGVLADTTTGAYTLEPIQNLIIDNSNWLKIISDGQILLQRQQKFVSIEDFLENLPNRSEIATYHFDLNEPYRLPDYVSSPTVVNQEIALRGSHEFYTYIKNEILNYEFVFVDENFRVGDDEVSLVVVDENSTVIGEIQVADSDEVFSVLTAKIEIPNLPEGVYKIQMKASDDIVFRSVATSQQKMTFLNHLWISQANNRVANFETPAAAITNGTILRFSTHLAKAAQTVLVNGQDSVVVSEPFFEYQYYSSEIGPFEVSASNSKDLLINTDGYLALHEWQYFNPDPVRLTAQTDLDRLGINYLVANYTPPTIDGEWLIGRAKFDLTNAAFDLNTWKFVFSLPTVDEPDREFLLNSIDTKLYRDKTSFVDFLRKIKQYVF